MPWVFNLIYLVALLIASPWLLYRSIKRGFREGWRQKLLGLVPGSLVDPHDARPTVWLHGVSVGEIQLLKPLWDKLRDAHPQTRFVVSTTTQSGMALAQKLFPPEVLFFFPFDFTWAVHRVLNTIKPSAIVLGELELWPNLIQTATQLRIPIAVVNARLSLGSFRGYQRFQWLTQGMFRRLHWVAAQDATYAQRFIDCGVPVDRVQVTGSTKFDNVNFDRKCTQVEQLRTLVGLNESQVVWIVGSTQSPEELTAAIAYMSLREANPNLRLIVVPRHPDRFDAVFHELQATGLSPIRRSLLNGPISADDWQVLLVDTVGELRWWWGLADIAIVGGSFGTRGGQNMLEPAAFGANVAFGPNTSNFRDICEILLDGGGAERLLELEQIQPWMRDQLARPEPGRQRGQKAQELIRAHQGALERTVAGLQAIIERRKPDQ